MGTHTLQILIQGISLSSEVQMMIHHLSYKVLVLSGNFDQQCVKGVIYAFGLLAA